MPKPSLVKFPCGFRTRRSYTLLESVTCSTHKSVTQWRDANVVEYEVLIEKLQCAREQMGSHLVAKYKKFQEYSHLLANNLQRIWGSHFDVLECLNAQNCLI